MSHAVALVNPKYPHNVGNVLRACSAFGADQLLWTPERVPAPEDWPKGARLPREERMRLYEDVTIRSLSDRAVLLDWHILRGYSPVAVEVRENAEPLPGFVHPEKAIYVFGPEDGSLDRGILSACHRFVQIPTRSCLNLASAVNVVLYDRAAKFERWVTADDLAQRTLGDMDPMPGEGPDEYEARMARAEERFVAAHPEWRQRAVR